MTRALVAVGHVTHDLYGSRLEAGGSAYYAAQVWRHLGARARVVTAFGTDFVAYDAFDGLEVSSLREGQTTAFRNLYLADGRSQSIAAVAPAVDVSGYPPHWGTPAVLFLCPVFGEVAMDAWVGLDAELRAIGLQGWIKTADRAGREGLVPVVRRAFEPSLAALGRVDIAFCSDEDLVGQTGLFECLRAHVGCLVRTRGAAGSDVYVDGRRFHVGIHPARQVDPTGAGDCFAAGFLFARHQGFDWADAARFAAAVASIVIEAQAGGSLPNVRAAFDRFREIRVESGLDASAV